MNFKESREYVDAHPELSSTEAMTIIMAARAHEGDTPTGDVEVLEPELIEYEERGYLKVRMPVYKWQTNGNLDVQGGMLTYMIDCAFGILGYIHSGRGHVTSVDLETNFLRPVNMDDEYVTIIAEAVTNGRRLMHANAKLLKTNGKVAVTGSTNIMKLA